MGEELQVAYRPLSLQEDRLSRQVIDIAVNIHKAIGPGLLESIYEKCFCYELDKRGILFERQKAVPLRYDKLIIDQGFASTS